MSMGIESYPGLPWRKSVVVGFRRARVAGCARMVTAKMANETKPRKTRVVVVERKAHADARLDIGELQYATMEEASRLYPNALELLPQWPVVTGDVIVARVRVELLA